jgi:hypothetical protein
MNATPNDRRSHAHELHDEPNRRSDEPDDNERDGDPRIDRTSQIDAAQLAAPSTRRWRRARRFDADG